MKLLLSSAALVFLRVGCGGAPEAPPGAEYLGVWQCTATDKGDVTVEIRAHETDFMVIDKGPEVDMSRKVNLEADGKLFFKMGGITYTINDDGTLQCGGLGCPCGKDPYKKAG